MTPEAPKIMTLSKLGFSRFPWTHVFLWLLLIFLYSDMLPLSNYPLKYIVLRACKSLHYNFTHRPNHLEAHMLRHTLAFASVIGKAKNSPAIKPLNDFRVCIISTAVTKSNPWAAVLCAATYVAFLWWHWSQGGTGQFLLYWRRWLLGNTVYFLPSHSLWPRFGSKAL